MGRGLSVASRGKERESGRQCKEEGSGSRSGLHGLLLGPLVFEALKKWRNPSLVPVPIPSPTPTPTPTPPYPHPTPALSQAPRLSLLPQPKYPVSRFPHAFRGANSPAAEETVLSSRPSGLQITRGFHQLEISARRYPGD